MLTRFKRLLRVLLIFGGVVLLTETVIAFANPQNSVSSAVGRFVLSFGLARTYFVYARKKSEQNLVK